MPSPAQRDDEPLGIVIRPKLERGVVEPQRLPVGAERCSTFRRFTQREPGGLGHVADLQPRGFRVVECGAVVVREHLCAVVRTIGRQRLDPLRCGPMLRGAIRAWDLPVRDLAYEDVTEFPLRLPGNRRTARATDKLAPRQGVERPLELGDRNGAE